MPDCEYLRATPEQIAAGRPFLLLDLEDEQSIFCVEVEPGTLGESGCVYRVCVPGEFSDTWFHVKPVHADGEVGTRVEHRLTFNTTVLCIDIG